MTQRLYKTASITSGATIATNQFFFEGVPMGSVWTGTIEVINAPAGAFHTAMISGIIWAQWAGFGPSPVVQAIAGEVIEVDSIGLLANTVYQASIIGKWDDETNYEPVWPLNTGILLTGPATIQPQTITTSPAGGSNTFGPFNVAGFIGMRFSLLVESLFSNALVDIRWYDTLALAQNPGAYDTNSIFDFTVLSGKSASFQIPHQGDWLVITVSSADAGQTKYHWAAANRQVGFDIHDEGTATGNANVDIPASANGTIAGPPSVNGPWYRIKTPTVRANGTPTAGALVILGLSDDGVNLKTWIAAQRATATVNEVYFGDFVCDLLIRNPTRLFLQASSAAVDMRVGCSWEVVPPMFNFPQDS